MAFSRLCWDAALTRPSNVDPRYDTVLYDKSFIRSNPAGGLGVEDADRILHALEHPPKVPSTFSQDDIPDLPSLAAKLKKRDNPAHLYLAARLTESTRQALAAWSGFGELGPQLEEGFLEDLNRVLTGPPVWQAEQLSRVRPPPEVRNLPTLPVQGEQLLRLNRLFLAHAYPELSRPATPSLPALCTLQADSVRLHLSLLQPLTLVRALLGHTRPDHDLRYFAHRSLWISSGCRRTSTTTHLFHLLARVATQLRTADPEPYYRTGFLRHLEQAISSDIQLTGIPRDEAEKLLRLFIESCRVTGYIGIAKTPARVDLRTEIFDPEFLLSTIYGLPTAIRGFDDLFGGGGLLLAENLPTSPLPQDPPGRIIVIKGPFGTGKTLLALQLAVEVARKGGVVLSISLEQPARQAVCVLESMECLPESAYVSIVQDQLSRRRALAKKDPAHGVLAFTQASKASYSDFLTLLVDNSKRLQQFPLRLINIDPTNSISGRTAPMVELRAHASWAFQEIREHGTNLVLVAESAQEQGNDYWFEENIADTVIHLSTSDVAGYVQRRFEIVKSRLQREQRGIHPFSIVAGEGIRIYPSSAAVLARVKSRTIREPSKTHLISFGLTSMDRILGSDALMLGDVIAFKGPGGSLKTALGLLFLLGRDQPKSPANYQSLLVAARDPEGTVRHILRQPFITNFIKSPTCKRTDQVRVCSLPSGHVNPGYIFQRLEDEFTEARRRGVHIDRVMIDNVSHWEMTCPLLRADETFGDTMLDFLRRQKVTSLLVCGADQSDREALLQRSIIDGADCVVDFDRFEFRGGHRVMVRVLKTRGMSHRHESFELSVANEELQIHPTASLIRLTKGGETRPVKIMLFLHSETDAQKQYNASFRDSVKAALSPDTDLISQDRVYMSKVMTLGPASVVDELQVLQLDEFQLPKGGSTDQQDLTLHKFERYEWREGDWRDYLAPLRTRCWASQAGKHFIALPFYENISLIAYRNSISPATVSSWESLARACRHWEAKHPNGIYFDFPQVSSENFNCLFFEILLSLAAGSANAQGSQVCLLMLLHSDLAVDAAKLFRQLGRRAYLSRPAPPDATTSTSGEPLSFDVEPHAFVWRHWYTTLNQMMSKLQPPQRQRILVAPLPNNVAIAGEWYLGIPAYSAAADVGLDIIRLLTSKDAELNRFRLGVGLPTRSTFYAVGKNSPRRGAEISPYFSMSAGLQGVQTLINNAFRRSDFHCYRKISRMITFYLQKVLELPKAPRLETRSGIRNLLAELRGSEEFVQSDWDCSACPYRDTKNVPKK
jgi:KaiC/GvpD/RAD55 family RecA-like ATPase